jgi:hypothetical protein
VKSEAANQKTTTVQTTGQWRNIVDTSKARPLATHTVVRLRLLEVRREVVPVEREGSGCKNIKVAKNESEPPSKTVAASRLRAKHIKRSRLGKVSDGASNEQIVMSAATHQSLGTSAVMCTGAHSATSCGEDERCKQESGQNTCSHHRHHQDQGTHDDIRKTADTSANTTTMGAAERSKSEPNQHAPPGGWPATSSSRPAAGRTPLSCNQCEQNQDREDRDKGQEQYVELHPKCVTVYGQEQRTGA